MIPSRRQLLRPVLLPVLLVAAALSVAILVGTRAPVAEPTTAGPSLPPVVTIDPAGCRRDHDLTTVSATPILAAGHRVTSTLIVSCPARFDGVRVTYLGEVVGDLLRREGGAWVLVNDDDYALRVGPLPGHRDHRGMNTGLSVWLPDPLPAQLTGLGRPGVWGDIIEVSGTIVRADPTDGGGLTLRADGLTVRQPARAVHAPVDPRQVLLAAGAGLAAALTAALRRRAAKRPRPSRDQQP